MRWSSSTRTIRCTIVSRLKPDVLVKGADWALDAIIGADLVQAGGGRVVRIADRRRALDVGDNREDTVRLKADA